MLPGTDGAGRNAGRGPGDHASGGGGVGDDHYRGCVPDKTCFIPWRQALLTPSAESETSAVVTFANVRIGFDEGDILRDVSFAVMPRETLVLLGETGTGKTLTLKMAAGLLRRERGKIEVLGKEVSSMNEHDLLTYRRQLGFVFQE